MESKKYIKNLTDMYETKGFKPKLVQEERDGKNRNNHTPYRGRSDGAGSSSNEFYLEILKNNIMI